MAACSSSSVSLSMVPCSWMLRRVRSFFAPFILTTASVRFSSKSSNVAIFFGIVLQLVGWLSEFGAGISVRTTDCVLLLQCGIQFFFLELYFVHLANGLAGSE
jgi:hypothetical protein